MWNKKQLLITSAILSSAISLPATASDVSAEFDKGYFKFASADGNFKWKFDGRIMLDAKNISEHEGENLISTNADFRRARLAIKTQFYKDWAGEFDIDFKNNKTKVKDMWVSYDPFENATIKIGNHKPFFSIAEVTTSRWYPLMETSSISDFSAPGRRVGVSFDYWDPRYFVGVSIFGEETKMNDEKDDLVDDEIADAIAGAAEDGDDWDDVIADIEDNIADWEKASVASERTGYSARALYRPIINEDASRFFHVGASVLKTTPFAVDLDYVKMKGEVHDIAFLYQKLKPWKGLHVDDIQTTSLEIAARYDKFYFQSEYINNDFSFKGENSGVDYKVDGYYAELSYFLLGDGRPYNLSDGEFGPVIPSAQNGDLEFIVRYDTMDANNSDTYLDNKGKTKDLMSGKLTNWTFGVNWYVNTNIIIRLNHSIVETDENADIADADVNITAGRLEFLF
ncbi:OprO/OprP family phosphate-selective porin [Thalassotalea aquiviva]|uniref:OprO/OprP family phosphate-selective porin n=1 Tax=Thalassotalea aquiviva TaxID=3242415 RepID=UPI00352A8E50